MHVERRREETELKICGRRRSRITGGKKQRGLNRDAPAQSGFEFPAPDYCTLADTEE